MNFNPSFDQWNMLIDKCLELLSILLTWQFLFFLLILIMVFSDRSRGKFGELLRMIKIKKTGNTWEFESSEQTSREKQIENEKKKTKTFIGTNKTQGQSHPAPKQPDEEVLKRQADSLKKLNENLLKALTAANKSDQSKKAVIQKGQDLIDFQKKYIQILKESNEFQEFRYLNLFLVPSSKIALYIISGNPGAKSEIFARVAVANVKNPEAEKDAIFKALLNNDLIKRTSGEILEATDKGLRFLDYLQRINKST